MPSTARRRPGFDQRGLYAYPEHLREAVQQAPAAPGVYVFHAQVGLQTCA